ncbi:uncharacterized protein LOC135840027 [Planococcus citri]|uniref:uncharacterized protein LOC135840027 n=1 Tax=Planococcus citri TaxID=170843 RepID=UPI0031F9C192
MNVTYRRPRRKSMLGTRLSILHDNIELGREDIQPPQENIEVKPVPDLKPYIETRSRKAQEDSESFTQVLKNIEILLEKNSETLKTLLQEREQLEKIEQMLRNKINSSKDESETCKENQPPNENTPTKFKQKSNQGNNRSNENTPTKLFSTHEGNKNNDGFVAPHNPAIDTMRSSIKFLKTPRPSRQTRKSIMLTPHSFSFSIHKQFESLKE